MLSTNLLATDPSVSTTAAIPASAARIPKSLKKLPVELMPGKKRSLRPLPEVILTLLLAEISTFFPEMEILPLGAEMLIPVKAFSVTLPKADWMVTERESDEAEIS